MARDDKVVKKKRTGRNVGQGEDERKRTKQFKEESFLSHSFTFGDRVRGIQLECISLLIGAAACKWHRLMPNARRLLPSFR